jgi:hypothetical protein
MQNAPEPFGWGAEIRSGLNAKRPAAGSPGRESCEYRFYSNCLSGGQAVISRSGPLVRCYRRVLPCFI